MEHTTPRVYPNPSLPTHRSLDDPSKMTLLDECFDSRLPRGATMTVLDARQPVSSCARAYSRCATHSNCFTNTDIVSATSTLIPPRIVFDYPCTTIQQFVSFERCFAATYWEASTRRTTRPGIASSLPARPFLYNICFGLQKSFLRHRRWGYDRIGPPTTLGGGLRQHSVLLR